MSEDFYNINNNGGIVSANCTSVSPSCSSSRWITEDVFKLIEIVQHDEAIYNPRHKFYFCRPYVENFWREVDTKLEKNPGSSLAKWTNLRISFRREYSNYLEEKIPPCWTYFDSMFFLHPFLRKKQHTPGKSLDTQLQDALIQYSSISNRFQRERCLATNMHSPSNGTVGTVTSHTQQMDNYFEYFDETEHNNSELNDIIDDEQQSQFLLPNDIKSECEDVVDDYEVEQIDKTDDNVVTIKETPNDIDTARSLANIVDKRESQQQQQPLRLQQLNRLQARNFHDEWRSKRPCSQENAVIGSRSGSASGHSHANVSFVRPTFNKSAHSEVANGTNTTPTVLQSQHISDLHGPNIQSLNTSTASQNNMRRLELSAGSNSSSLANTSNNGPSIPTPVELCDCKTDPDAMFLMSLLPDIQKLNGRDRGKIKIAFQNILQDYLYPD